MTASWGASSANGSPLSRYEWGFIQGSSWSGQTTARTAPANGTVGTTYAIHVRGCNAAGCSDWTNSNAATPTQPPPKVTLSKGTPEGTGYYYNVDVEWFPPNTSQRLVTYCNGGYFRETTLQVGGDGKGRLYGSWGTASGWCGYNDVWATVGGHESNHMDFRR